jgi:hypothetical protein
MRLIAVLALWAALESAHAVEIEPKGKALKALLGTTQVKRKVVKVGGEDTEVFYTKDKGKLAFIQKGLYEPNCTHTWAVGATPAGKITSIRVIEMSCPHAFPTKASSYLDQYKGKGPADVATLSAKIKTIAKATGSSNLTTDAAKRVITAAPKVLAELD